MWNRFCVLTQSECKDGITDKSERPCANWDTVALQCLFVTQVECSVVYYRVVLSHLDEIENPLRVQEYNIMEACLIFSYCIMLNLQLAFDHNQDIANRRYYLKNHVLHVYKQQHNEDKIQHGISDNKTEYLHQTGHFLYRMYSNQPFFNTLHHFLSYAFCSCLLKSLDLFTKQAISLVSKLKYISKRDNN